MKYILSLLASVILLSQCATQKQIVMNGGNYDTYWKSIDSLQQKGLYKSALEETEALYKMAEKDGNKVHKIKALITECKMISQLEEDQFDKIIHRFEIAISQEKEPDLKAILYSYAGELYYSYAQQNQYRINHRTAVAENSDALAGMTMQELMAKSNLYFMNSVELSSKTDLSIIAYQEIIKGKDENWTELDLYSFLGIRAAKHFKQNHSMLPEPVNAFKLMDSAAFSSGQDFSRMNFGTSDDLSFSLKTLGFYQDLLSHLNQKQDDYWYERVDLDRLLYVNQQYKGGDNVSLFEKGLEKMIAKVKNPDFKTYVIYQLANSYFQQGNLYQQNFDQDKKLLKSKARTLAKVNLEKYPDSKGAPYLQRLIQSIDQKSLSVSIEEVIPANEAQLISVSYQNINELFFKIVSFQGEDLQRIQRLKQDEIKSFLNQLPVVRTWSKSTFNADHNLHTSELIVDGLDFGKYGFLVSDDANFEGAKAEFHWGGLQVSNLAYQVENGYDHLHYTVTDRRTGAPVAHAQLTFFQQNYNSRTRRQEFIELGEGVTDQNGFYKSTLGNRKGIKVIVSKGNDVLDLESYQSYYPRNKNRASDDIVLLTDRNLYRPGQSVQVKGIVLRNTGQGVKTKVVASTTVNIFLRDSNGREIYKGEYATNEFGSFSTIISLPDSGLNGSYSLNANTKAGNGYHNIKVEEYKRPRFEVAFDDIESFYALGDHVTVDGSANMYSGVAVANAEVRYRVYREARYRHYYYHYSRGYPSGQAQVIAYGITQTDDQGRFSIQVPLVGSSKYNRWNPRYSFEVKADVIDDTGETQTGSTSILASKDAYFFSLNRSGDLDKNDMDSLQLQIKNVKDLLVDYSGQFIITKLKQPASFKRNKYWNQTDTLIESASDYALKVPFDFMGSASGYRNWATEKTIGSYSISNASTVNLSDKITETGVYKIEVKEGDETLFEDYLNIHDFEVREFTTASALYTKINKKSFEPGEQVILKVGSGLSPLKVLYELEKGKEIVERKWITINQNTKNISIPVTGKDRGGFVIHLTTIYKNRYDKKTINVVVPWTNKMLDVSVSHFRSSIDPGSKEEWTVSIKGKKAQKLSSELVVSMYDMSLDQLHQAHQWSPFINNTYHSHIYKQVLGFGSRALQQIWRQRDYNQESLTPVIEFPELKWFDLKQFLRSGGNVMVRGSAHMKRASGPPQAMESVEDSVTEGMMMDEMALSSTPPVTNEPALDETDFDWSQVRKNLNETAFFFPQLQTDRDGNVQLKFTMSEALTQWKVLLLAHSKDAQSGYKELELKTSKSLMVFPNAPRFGRVGDRVMMTSKVSNLSDETMSGKIRLEIIDPVTNEEVNTGIIKGGNEQNFSLASKASASVSWNLGITDAHQSGLIYRVLATSDKVSDGEEAFLPVLTDQVFLTESLPIYVKGSQKKSIEFSQLNSILKSKSSKVKQVTLEWVSNPTWYAVQALPYLNEKSHESAEQIFHRFFANRLGSKILESNPQIEQTFKRWKALDQSALESTLYKNQDLKSAIIEETPWLRQADNESAQKQNIAQFFDSNNLKVQQTTALQKLMDLQNGDGGFSWYPGSRSSVFITAKILEGVTRLQTLDAFDLKRGYTDKMSKAHVYLGEKIRKMLSVQKDRTFISSDLLYLLYVSMAGDDTQKYAIKSPQLLKDWQTRSVRDQALLALVLYEMDDSSSYDMIIASLKERVIRSSELGFYWNSPKDFSSNRSKLDEQIFLLHLFQEVVQNEEISDGIKMWLIRNKHTNHWKSTSATASAIYGLLVQKDHAKSWLVPQKSAKISVNNKAVTEIQKSIGSLYFRKNWTLDELNAESMKVDIENLNEVPGWGALYVQYFEDIDQVKNDLQDHVSIDKSIFIEENSDKGPVLHSVVGREIKPGDKIVVRLKLTSDRPLEYVHLKDLRASGTEPIQTLSAYKYQDGLSYYEMTKDASTHFFISFMQKGSYVFEYRLRANLAGDFSSGMASLQCMYAPEFVTHSNSVAVKVE